MDTLLTTEQLNGVQELASLYFTPREIQMMLQLTDGFIRRCEMEGTPEYVAFQSGRLQEEMLQRKAVLTLAKQGSSPAQAQAKKIFDDSAAKMVNR